MSGRKNKFSKIKSHLKSTKIDEKIGYLDNEMRKMGVISEVMANTTSDLYCTTEYIPPVPASPAEYTDVPDSSGVRSVGWSQPSNGYDENDPSTWENAYNDFSWLFNSNDVAGETGRPVVQSVNPDWSGAAPGGGMAGAHVGHGASLGYLADGVYKPLVTSNMFGSMVPPTDAHRGSAMSGAHYYGITDEQWGQMQALYAAYESTTFITTNIKVWYPYSYFWYGNWDDYNGTKKDTADGRFVLINGFVSINANRYESKAHENEIPGRTVVLTQHSLDDGNYYAGNVNGFMNFLRDALGASKEAFEWLLDLLDDAAVAGAGGSPGQEYTDPNDGKKFAPNSLPKGWKPGDPIPAKLAMNTQAARDMIIRGQVPMMSPGQAREILNNPPKGHEWDIDTESILRRLMVQRDSDTQIASDSGGYYNKFGEFVPNLQVGNNQQVAWGGGKKEKTIDPNNQNVRKDVQYAVMGAYRGGEEAFVQKYGYSSSDISKFIFQGIPLPKKKKNENYEPQGELISEGWESPKYTYIDKNQQKRWFKEKDVAPVYPKKAPPKMMNGYHPDLLPKLDTPIPQIKVKKKDLLRGHHLKKDEAQRLIDLVDRLNDYIKRNPEHLAYARERYPKSDPRLATLNYKMDMQIAAADEYVEKHFPENKRLLNKVLKATKQSIKLTDPKTFKSEDGVFTTFNKLERARHFDNEYKPKERKVLKKRRSKSVSRFFYKPKKKTKYDILKDKMVVLDKEIKKTMPDM